MCEEQKRQIFNGEVDGVHDARVTDAELLPFRHGMLHACSHVTATTKSTYTLMVMARMKEAQLLLTQRTTMIPDEENKRNQAVCSRSLGAFSSSNPIFCRF